MVSAFVFFIILIISYFVVKVGAAAFEITGLDQEQAHFQALSAFTGTGFTTKEAELITAYKERRKIASVLMILGKAGFVTLIATLVTTINPEQPPGIFIPALEGIIPGFLLRYVHLFLIFIILLVGYRLFHASRLSKALIKSIQRKMLSKKLFQKVRFEELLLNSQGYGISQIEVTDKNPLAGKTLSESHLRDYDILVLSVERANNHIINPAADLMIMPHDNLVCFGKLENMRELVYEDTE
jgi:Trk-type K+ transport system membrane component